MKVLHVYPKSENLIERHVSMLIEGMRQSVETGRADNATSFRKEISAMRPDIIHIHGCLLFSLKLALAIRSARNSGIRTVVTLHGQLEPWMIQQQNAQEKTRNLLIHKETIQRAFAVITLGRLERTNFEKTGWNRRIEEIHNAVITNAISPEEMCAKTFAVYQKIIDSNTLENMDETSTDTLADIIKAGITGDRRWIKDFRKPASVDWRRLLIYAEHEGISNYVDYGINILGLSTPIIDISRISAYFPNDYSHPRPIKDTIGNYQGDETEYVFKIIRQINRQPLLLHLIELTRELYRDNMNEDRLREMLEDKGLLTYTSRLMQVLSEQTRLDEGYMPVEPIDDRQTEQIRKLLTNHLKI